MSGYRTTGVTTGKTGRMSAIKTGMLLLELIMIIFTLAYFFPVYTIISIALKTTREVIFSPLALPKSLYIDNFIQAWKIARLDTVFLNSVFISLFAVVFRILLASMAAFTLAKKKSRVNDMLYVYFLSGIMIPIYTVLVPMIRLIKNLGFMNSQLGLSIVYIGTGMPFAVFLLVGFIRRPCGSGDH